MKSIFKIEDFPLNGQFLIEASAGSGKTFTLIIIFLKVLLKNAIHPSISTKVKLDDILIVTFTNLAASELSERIVELLIDAKLIFEEKITESKYFVPINSIRNQVVDTKLAITILNSSIKNIDKLSIYTIHGFCHKFLYDIDEVLQTNPMDLISNTYNLKKRSVSIFWKKYYLKADSQLLEIISSLWSTPTQLLNKIDKLIDNSIPITEYYKIEKIEENLSYFNSKIYLIRELWTHKEEIFDEIFNLPCINKRKYNRRNMRVWQNKIDLFLNSSEFQNFDKEVFVKFSLSNFQDQINSNENKILYQFSSAIDNLVFKSNQIIDMLVNHAVNETKNSFNILKEKLNLITYDDLIKRTSEIFNSDDRYVIKETSNKFPYVLIDEFQDTDQNQYDIFNINYELAKPESLLCLIGDPKQSIYSFRGADIDVYHAAIKNVNQIFYLDCSFRSSEKFIEGINSIFSLREDPFCIGNRITYQSLLPSPISKVKTWFVNNKENKTIKFLISNKMSKKHETFEKIIKETANEIYKILDSNVSLYDGNNKKHVQKKDITILVRTNDECLLVKKKLKQLEIESEIVSNKKNVFESHLIINIIYLLELIDDPSNLQKLSSFLCCDFFANKPSDLNSLLEEEKTIEAIRASIYEYRKIIINDGLFAMILIFIERERIYEHLQSDKDRNRLIDDFLYISETLNEEFNNFYHLKSFIRWLCEGIISPESMSPQETHESSEDAIKISTIHNSKGLEYSIVFLPFIFYFNIKKSSIDYDIKNKRYCLSKKLDKEILKNPLFKEEIRLLYVAITRAIYGCYLGVVDGYNYSPLNYIINCDTNKTLSDEVKCLCNLNENFEVIDKTY
ncbi:hypothetical protein CF386_01490 [Paraphotobacterium marinum]|uniref:DNA 3'-5' helicase n=1 Tax=Paraphotobacterium marinum TaxID=1755811 RepID=A0A220VBW2_9GAMM|nr:UvrD-helicase domain-containing protein [Paraphotobacterium marinum]ASK77835.1 hypothetical protein CF386_01490 [Paraphotobacterium marinum]